MIAGQGTAIRIFGSGSFGGGATAAFINNSGNGTAGLPVLDSRDNCVLGGTGVLVVSAKGRTGSLLRRTARNLEQTAQLMQRQAQRLRWAAICLWWNVRH